MICVLIYIPGKNIKIKHEKQETISTSLNETESQLNTIICSKKEITTQHIEKTLNMNKFKWLRLNPGPRYYKQ